MPAALKTPLTEPIAPDNLSIPAAATSSRAATSVSTSNVAEHKQVPQPRFVRSRPQARAPRPVEPTRAKSRDRHHRPLRVTFTAILCGGALMGQLVLLLWLHGKTLTSAREVEKLDTQIAEASNHIERTQERIAAFDSSPQIKQWAAQKNWRAATHTDFDDVTNIAAARAAAQIQPEATQESTE